MNSLVVSLWGRMVPRRIRRLLEGLCPVDRKGPSPSAAPPRRSVIVGDMPKDQEIKPRPLTLHGDPVMCRLAACQSDAPGTLDLAMVIVVPAAIAVTQATRQLELMAGDEVPEQIANAITDAIADAIGNTEKVALNVGAPVRISLN